MGEKEEEDSYRNFARKDLQVLCKKYGLPANKSNSEMATSLILYLEEKNIDSRSVWEVARRDPYPSGLTELPAALSMKSVGDQSKDCRYMASIKGGGNAQFSSGRYSSAKNIQERKGTAPSEKASGDIGVETQLNIDRNSGSSIPENAISSVVSSTTEAPLPSFTFEVFSEDGIQLCVDLDSNPSDWIESMKAGVHICSGAHNLKADTSHQEPGQICRSSEEKEENGGQLKDASDPTMEITGVAPPTDEPVGGEVSLSSPRLKSFSFTVHNLEDLGHDQAVLSSRSGADIDGQNCGPESAIRFEKVLATDPEKLVATQIKTGNFSGMADNHKFADAGRQGLYEEPCLQQTCRLPDTIKVNRSGDASMEIQESDCNLVPRQEVGSSFLRVGTRLDSADQLENTEIAHSGLFNSKPYRDVLQMHPVQTSDRSQYASSSLSMGCPDNLGHMMEMGHGRTSFVSKSNWNILEAQTPPGHSCKRPISLFPFQRSQTLDFANFCNSFETPNIGVMSSDKAGREVIEPLKKDEYLNPRSSDQRFDLSASIQSGVNHYILNYSSDFDKDKCQSQKRTDVVPDVVNLSERDVTEKVGLISSHTAGQEAVELRRKDASLSRGLAVPEQNGANHCCLNYSNNLDKGICCSQTRTALGVRGGSKTGNVMGSSDFSDFRKSMEKPWKKAACSETNGELDKKRHFSCVENNNHSMSPEADILRASKHFTGDARVSHRRSSRLVTKGPTKLKSNFRN